MWFQPSVLKYFCEINAGVQLLFVVCTGDERSRTAVFHFGLRTSLGIQALLTAKAKAKAKAKTKDSSMSTVRRMALTDFCNRCTLPTLHIAYAVLYLLCT
jgi:hypothetical protein